MATPEAICGSRPMATNSVVPIAKPPRASASSARRRWALAGSGVGAAGAGGGAVARVGSRSATSVGGGVTGSTDSEHHALHASGFTHLHAMVWATITLED